MHALPHLSPSSWVQRFMPLIKRDGDVLDLASGRGRHARLLAQCGYRVEAVDRDAEALATLAGIAAIVPRVVDLEEAAWPYGTARFDGIVVCNYLYRPRLDDVIAALRPGGVLIYETFMIGNEVFGKPSNPDFLLQPDELFDRVRPRLQVAAFEQGVVDAPRPAAIQRICAVAAITSALPS